MSRCLNAARIQAVADHEGTVAEQLHVAACPECDTRVTAARAAVQELTSLASALPVPPFEPAAPSRVVAGAPMTNRGATTLRAQPPPSRWAGRVWVPAGAIAAAAVALFFWFAPGAPRTLSAAEILNRSIESLAPAGGTELLEYDLDLHLPSIVSVENGTYRVHQLVDHDARSRFRIAKYSPDGTLVGALGEDAKAGRRSAYLLVDGQPFAFDFAIDPSQTVAFRDLQRHHAEAVIRLLQAGNAQTVSREDGPEGPRYVVELPKATDETSSDLWALDQARVVVEGVTYRILALDASGSYMGEPFSISFRLRNRSVRPSAQVDAREFDVPRDAAAITISGTGSPHLPRDVVTSALRELARARAAQ